MDPERFLEHAEEVLQRFTPCDCRVAIGRAYYGVLQKTAELFVNAGLTLPARQQIHQKLWQDLQATSFVPLKEAGYLLAAMHGLRITADYDMSNTDPEKPQLASLWVRRARLHLTNIKSLFATNQAQIVREIKTYRAKVGR